MPSVLLRAPRRMLSGLGVGALAAVSIAVLSPASPAFAAPANDNFVNAELIPDMGSPNVIAGSNIGATKESGEPNHAGNTGGSSIWYVWTAPTDATVSVTSYLLDANGNNVVHAAAVYTGSAVNALDDETAALASVPSLSFDAVAGVTYHLAIDRSKTRTAGSTQTIFKAVATNDNFGAATVISGGSGSTTGHNGNATQESGEVGIFNESGINSVWYSWVAPSTGRIAFDTSGSDFDTLLAAYTGSSVDNLAILAADDDCINYESCIEFDTTAGSVYRIEVDGYRSNTGDITLNWEPVVVCTIPGDNGDNTLTGTAGDDVICGYGGNDTIRGMGGNDTIIGGDGVDTADFSGMTAGVIVDLRTTPGTATGQGNDTLQEIENLTGSPGSDKLTGDAGPNVINGLAGADGVYGDAGDDQLYGGSGPDTLGAREGVDYLDGGTQLDTIVYGNLYVPVTVDLSAGTTTSSTDGDDTFTSIENVRGSRAGDTLNGDFGPNIMEGTGGNDTIQGFSGNDTLYGDNGSDSLLGGGGRDTCDGGAQADTASACETLVNIPKS